MAIVRGDGAGPASARRRPRAAACAPLRKRRRDAQRAWSARSAPTWRAQSLSGRLRLRGARRGRCWCCWIRWTRRSPAHTRRGEQQAVSSLVSSLQAFFDEMDVLLLLLDLDGALDRQDGWRSTPSIRSLHLTGALSSASSARSLEHSKDESIALSTLDSTVTSKIHLHLSEPP